MTRTDSIKFILAGNAKFTFLNRISGNRFTYNVKALEDNPNLHFVSVLSGSDNENSYRYIGIITNKTDFKITKKSTVKEDTDCFKVFKYVFTHLIMNDLPEFIEIYHEGTCGRCGRTLTVPESIASGLGPECAKRV